MIIFYRILGYLLCPLAIIYLKWRSRKGKEDKHRIRERQGNGSVVRPTGDLVWIHAASVGESLSALAVIERLRETLPKVQLLLTTGTLGSAALMKERLPKEVIHQYFPLDLTPWVKRFLDHWKPNLVLWLESELWPAHLSELRYRNVKTILLNARLSKSSFKKWVNFPYYFRKLTSLFDKIYAGSLSDKKKFHKLGVMRAAFEGNLKTLTRPLVFDQEKLDFFAKAVKGRLVWLAASTHAGEEVLIADVQNILKTTLQSPLCILVPRHPDRAREIANLFTERGLKVCQRTLQEHPDSHTDVYIADTLGELDLFYQVAPISFVGGSLVPVGGHNIIEAIRAGSAVIVGPYTANFSDIVEEFSEHKACIIVKDKHELNQKLLTMFRDEKETQRILHQARALLDSRSQFLDKLSENIRKYLNV